MASYFLYLHILNIVFFRIHSFTNLYTLQSFSYQLLICRVAKNLPVLELLNHFIKSSTVAYKRVAYKKSSLLCLEPDFLSVAYLTVWNLSPSIQSDSSPSAGLQVVTHSSHLSKDCYPQLVSNPHRSEIRPSR